MIDENKLLQLDSNGRTALENILSNHLKNNFFECTFKKEESLRIILAYKRYDLLKNVSINNLLRPLGNGTYLDYILPILKNNKDYKNLVMEPFEKCITNEQIVAVYLIYCRHQCLYFLPNITREQLFEKKNNKFASSRTLLEAFKDAKFSDEERISFIIKRYFKKDEDILNMFNNTNNLNEEVSFEKTEIADNSISEKYVNYFNNKHYSDYDNLSLKEKRLIDALMFKLQNRCTSDELDVIKRSYSAQLANRNKGTEKEINLLCDLLDNDPYFFVINGKDSVFSVNENIVSLNSKNIYAFDHEIGHVLFHKVAKMKIEDEFEELADNIRFNSKHLKKVKELSDLFQSEMDKAKNKAIKILEDNKNLSQNDEKDYEELINNIENSAKDLENQGASKETIERLLSSSCTLEEFKERKREDRIGKLKLSIMQCDNCDIYAICDIVDAIYVGEYKNYKLKDEDGKTIKPTIGHGLYYYNKDETTRFNEIIANYSSIRKSKNRRSIRLLKYYTSKEFVNYLERYYNNYILNGSLEEVDRRFL